MLEEIRKFWTTMAHGNIKHTLPVISFGNIHYLPVSLTSYVSESLALYPIRKHVRFSKQKKYMYIFYTSKFMIRKDPSNVGRDS